MLRRLLIGWWAVALAIPVAAQDVASTPAVDQRYIIGAVSEVIFPQAVRFVVSAARPAGELTAATLTIHPDGQPPLTVQVSLDGLDPAAAFTELAYVWTIPREAPPRLFQPIVYEWRLSSRSDGAARLAGELVFTDQRADWAARPDPGGQISLTMPDSGDAANVLGRLRRDLQPVYDRLVDETRRRESFNFLIYPRDRLSAGCVTGASGQPAAIGPTSRLEITCDPSLADVIFQTAGYTRVESETSGGANLRSALVAAMVSRFYRETWAALPEWFRAGLVELYRPDPKSAYLPSVIAGVRARRLFDLQSAAPDDALWRAQSYAMVAYIADQAGVEGVLQLASDGGQTAFAEVYEAVMNRPLAALLPDLEQWVFTASAEAAFAFTLYQPATPTPTLTRTIPPAPSRTPTPEPSPTLPASDTPISPARTTLTPLPSPTPTRTPTPAPPTVTPRPAGSLNTPTPEPPPAQALAQSPAGWLALVSIVLLAGAILILAVSLLRRR